jgi:hypothetical protein
VNSSAAPSLFDFLDTIVDAAELFTVDRGFTLEGAYVDKATFKSLYRLSDGSNRMVFNIWGTGENLAGSISVKTLKGDLANVPIKLLAGAPAKTFSFYDSIAMTTLESPGAPLQLQDENVVNLSKTFSKYGYLANALKFPGALLPVKFGA